MIKVFLAHAPLRSTPLARDSNFKILQFIPYKKTTIPDREEIKVDRKYSADFVLKSVLYFSDSEKGELHKYEGSDIFDPAKHTFFYFVLFEMRQQIQFIVHMKDKREIRRNSEIGKSYAYINGDMYDNVNFDIFRRMGLNNYGAINNLNMRNFFTFTQYTIENYVSSDLTVKLSDTLKWKNEWDSPYVYSVVYETDSSDRKIKECKKYITVSFSENGTKYNQIICYNKYKDLTYKTIVSKLYGAMFDEENFDSISVTVREKDDCKQIELDSIVQPTNDAINFIYNIDEDEPQPIECEKQKPAEPVQIAPAKKSGILSTIGAFFKPYRYINVELDENGVKTMYNLASDTQGRESLINYFNEYNIKGALYKGIKNINILDKVKKGESATNIQNEYGGNNDILLIVERKNKKEIRAIFKIVVDYGNDFIITMDTFVRKVDTATFGKTIQKFVNENTKLTTFNRFDINNISFDSNYFETFSIDDTLDKTYFTAYPSELNITIYINHAQLPTKYLNEIIRQYPDIVYGNVKMSRATDIVSKLKNYKKNDIGIIAFDITYSNDVKERISLSDVYTASVNKKPYFRWFISRIEPVYTFGGTCKIIVENVHTFEGIDKESINVPFINDLLNFYLIANRKKIRVIEKDENDENIYTVHIINDVSKSIKNFNQFKIPNIIPSELTIPKLEFELKVNNTEFKVADIINIGTNELVIHIDEENALSMYILRYIGANGGTIVDIEFTNIGKFDIRYEVADLVYIFNQLNIFKEYYIMINGNGLIYKLEGDTLRFDVMSLPKTGYEETDQVYFTKYASLTTYNTDVIENQKILFKPSDPNMQKFNFYDGRGFCRSLINDDIETYRAEDITVKQFIKLYTKTWIIDGKIHKPYCRIHYLSNANYDKNLNKFLFTLNDASESSLEENIPQLISYPSNRFIVNFLDRTYFGKTPRNIIYYCYMMLASKLDNIDAISFENSIKGIFGMTSVGF